MSCLNSSCSNGVWVYDIHNKKQSKPRELLSCSIGAIQSVKLLVCIEVLSESFEEFQPILWVLRFLAANVCGKIDLEHSGKTSTHFLTCRPPKNLQSLVHRDCKKTWLFGEGCPSMNMHRSLCPKTRKLLRVWPTQRNKQESRQIACPWIFSLRIWRVKSSWCDVI